ACGSDSGGEVRWRGRGTPIRGVLGTKIATAFRSETAPRVSLSPLSIARHVCGDCHPAPVSPSPGIRIATCTLTAVSGERRTGMDEREVAHEPHIDVVSLQARDAGRGGNVCEKCVSVDMCPVRQ